MKEQQYVITQSQIQEILKGIGECPLKYVQMSSAILVSLPELVHETFEVPSPEDITPELLEG